MDSKLQKSPLGLLQALNLQTLGQAPIAFSDRLVPTWDATTEYLRDLVVVRQLTATWTSGTGGLTANMLAEGQGEYVLGLSAVANLLGADGSEIVWAELAFVQAAGVIRLATRTTAPWLGNGGVTAINARSLEWWAPRPYLLRPSEAMRVTLALQPTGQVLTNTTGVEFSALVARLP